MEQLIALGTGNATVIRCYNTCFAIRDEAGCFLVDGGGGNGILRQLDAANIPLTDINNAFCSHSHTDHILGMVWVIRMIAQLMGQNKYQGTFTVYCHRELAEKLRTIALLTLTPGMTSFFDKTILFRIVENGETLTILDREITFFDILSAKEKQFGFTARLKNGKKLAFLGDEPYNDKCEPYVRGSDWMLSEAFCLYSQRETFKPYEKHHSTAKDAAELAERLGVPNLILWHTEDKTLATRRQTYAAEAREYYSGTLYVPDDLDVIGL
ncbi:MBL fold metallo-hydrolase [Desulfovibrio sp. OttesenSCG-928-O18]|nr:MBL fold metallo-hydrolase [Desulfovibrio sp. OttesenSCG-928-O18]